MFRFWSIPAALAACTICFGALIAGEEPPVKGAAKKAQPTPVRAIPAQPAPARETQWSDPIQVDTVAPPAIEAALRSATTAEFNESTLNEVLKFLASYHNINIYIDEAGLQTENIDKDELKITLSVSGVTLKSALNLILEPHNLTCVVRNEVLEVTGIARERQRNVVAIYPAADLVVASGDRKAELRSAEFLDCIRKTIDAEVWDVNGGDSSVTLHHTSLSLVVSAPSATHRKITSLLAGLRTAKEKLPSGLSAAGLPPAAELFSKLQEVGGAKVVKVIAPTTKRPVLATPAKTHK